MHLSRELTKYKLPFLAVAMYWHHPILGSALWEEKHSPCNSSEIKVWPIHAWAY